MNLVFSRFISRGEILCYSRSEILCISAQNAAILTNDGKQSLINNIEKYYIITKMTAPLQYSV